MKHIYKFLFIFVALLISKRVMAYPDFIGYGYSSCITCHYNGSGGGALNDYGRALFASEISARHVFPKQMEEEEIAALSGFGWNKPLPWWFRPGLKYRGLWVESNPGGSGKIDQWINMQNDANLNFFFDKKQTLTLVTTTTFADAYPPYAQVDKWGWYEKEFYLRWKQSNNFWLYAGQLDKTYGIRNVDHTASNRSPILLGQFSQSLGVVAHFTYPDWDIAVNPFFGNIYEDEDAKQKGVAVSGEYQIIEKFKVGGSFLTSESKTEKWKLAALTTRIGLSKGSALLGEFGLKERTVNNSTTDPTLGTYAWVESLISLNRGYNLLTGLEHSKSDIKYASPEVMKWTLALMAFPLPRTEIRAGVTNTKTFSDDTGNADGWTIQSQVHVSY
ncbi:MAG: hypothetical protein ACM3MG_06430 [Bacillota bacterium]